MEPKIAPESRTPRLTPEQFAHLGDGAIAYVRSMRSEDVTRLYPQAPEIGPGLTVFALLSADGSPIGTSGHERRRPCQRMGKQADDRQFALRDHFADRLFMREVRKLHLQ